MEVIRLTRSPLWAFLCFVLLASTLVAQQPTAQSAPQNPPGQQVQAQQEEPKAKPQPGKVLVPAGTRLPLVLHNSISTRSAKAGDPVYLETLFPVVLQERIVIPAGSYVSGEVVDAKRAGRVKGRAELMIRLNTMILPNGYTVNFNAIPTGAGTGGSEVVQKEGQIKGDTEKAADVGMVIKTTAAGAGIGAVAGRSGRGAGIGAAAGAGVGLVGVLLSRGPDAELPRGTTMDVILDRVLYLDADKVQFTDPGRASVLPGPPDRQRQRTRIPF